MTRVWPVSGSSPVLHQSSLFQLCSVLERSYWPHPPSHWQSGPDEKDANIRRFGSHRELSARDRWKWPEEHIFRWPTRSRRLEVTVKSSNSSWDWNYLTIKGFLVNWVAKKTGGINSVLQTVQLPAGISNLDSGLTDVDRDDLTHFGFLKIEFYARKR